MNNSIQRILFLLVALFSVMAVTPAKSEIENVDKSFLVKSGGTLTIESDQESIKVEAWDKQAVEVLVEKAAGRQKQLDGFKVNFDQKGNDIFVEGDGDRNNRVSVKFFIKVPQEFNLDLKTGGGSIGVADISGEVKVNTSGGSISIGNVIQGNVDANTSGGNIKVGDVDGNLKVDTSGGKIEAEMIIDDKNVDTHVNLDSSGGSITLHIPESLAASVSATLKITRSARRDYRIYSDFPLTIKGENSSKITAKGDINDGGDKITLSTTNGDIHIKMLEE